MVDCKKLKTNLLILYNDENRNNISILPVFKFAKSSDLQFKSKTARFAQISKGLAQITDA